MPHRDAPAHPPPFTRLTAPDPATNRVTSDLYDKLNQLMQLLADPPGLDANASAPAPNIRSVSTSAPLLASDHVLSATIRSNSTITLPPTRDVQNLGPYTILNSPASTASLNLGSTRNEVVDGAAPSTIILAPGGSIVLQPNPGSWLVLSKSTGSGTSSTGATGTNIAPGTGGVPIPPSGIPPTTIIPTNPPVVSVLPDSTDPLATIGQVVIFGGIPFTWTADPSGGPVGYWAQSVSQSVPVVFDTHAARVGYLAADYNVGDLYYETDTTVTYMVQIPAGVKTWLYYNGVAIDTLANIPSLGVNDINYTFQSSDYLQIWVWSGTAWNYAPGSGSGFTTFATSPATLPYGVWHQCDGTTFSITQNDATLFSVTPANVTGQYMRQ